MLLLGEKADEYRVIFLSNQTLNALVWVDV